MASFVVWLSLNAIISHNSTFSGHSEWICSLCKKRNLNLTRHVMKTKDRKKHFVHPNLVNIIWPIFNGDIKAIFP